MTIKTFIQCIRLQNFNKYMDFVKATDYETGLKNEPIAINDKTFDGKGLKETSIEKITAQTDLHKQLAEKYNLLSIATADNDFQKVLQILNWLTDHTFYNGAKLKRLNDNSLDILQYGFGKSFKNAINCREKAIAFADCLVAVGIKAYPVAMQSAKFGACHFTCHAYISELDKWCVFDPSFNSWFGDKSNNPIDIFEMREMFLQNFEPTVNGYNFNGTAECFDEYMNGFLKWCISNLSTWQDNSMDGRESHKWPKRKQFVSQIPNV